MKISTLLAPALCLALAGCDDAPLSMVCPGALQPSVVVNVFDAAGTPITRQARGWYTVGATTDSLRHRNPGDGSTQLAAFGPIGVYQLRVQPTGHAELSLPNIRVEEGACGPGTRYIDVQLEAAP